MVQEQRFPSTAPVYSPVFAKNTSVSRIFGENLFGENSSKISAGGGILGKYERALKGVG